MLKQPFTSPTSITPKADAVWVVGQTSLNDIAQTGQLVLSCYESQADYEAGMQPIGSKAYQITPDLYAKYYTGAVDHIASGYALAQAYQEVTGGSIPAVTLVVLPSFFANATLIDPAMSAQKV